MVKYDHLIGAIEIRMLGLSKVIDSTIRDLGLVYTTLDKKSDQRELVDFSGDILSSFSRQEALSRRLLKYFWSNCVDFDRDVLKWASKNSKITITEIERYVLKGWSPHRENTGKTKYSDLTSMIEPPPNIESWSILSDVSAMHLFGEKFIRNYLNKVVDPPRYFQRTLFFLYLVADFCHRQMDKSEFFEFVDRSKEIGLERLHFEEIIKNKNADVTSYLMAAAFLKHMDIRRLDLKYEIYLNGLKGVFGDPRSLGNRWGEVRKIEPDGFQKWLSALNEEDIVFFFDNLEGVIHPERKAFWLWFKRRASRIVVLLDPPQRSKLLKQYQGNEKMLSIVKRSYQFNSTFRSDQQIIIYFIDNYVFVEGSNTGFACQVYKESVFRSRFMKSFYEVDERNKDNIILERSYTPFRGSGSGIEDSWHHRDEWERDFLKNLSELDIYPDRAEQPMIRPHDSSSYKPKESFGREIEKVTKDREGTSPALTASPGRSTGAPDQTQHLKGEKSAVNHFDLFLDRLKEFGAEIIATKYNGRYWVIYDTKLKPIIDDMRGSGINVRLVKKGEWATSNRMAWMVSQ